MQLQKAENDASLPTEVIQQKISKEQSTASQYTRQYLNKMLHFRSLISKSLFQSLSINSQNSQFQYNKKSIIHLEINIKVVKSTINMEVVQLIANWGQFTVPILVLNIPHQNTKHGDCHSNGAYGNIYCGHFLGKDIAVKCIPVRSKASRLRAIKQWFLLRVASAAEIGPRVEKCLGFDMLMYENCIEFCMQVCKPIVSNKVNENLLYQNLAMMHNLYITHLDIKPQNVMLSPAHRKPVFIDFGLSRFIREEIGYKSMTTFIGSITYCSKQMSQCFWQNEPRAIDLYYNDLFSLQTTIKFIKSRNMFETEDQNEIQEQNCKVLTEMGYLIEYLLKFHLYNSEIKKFFTLWKDVSPEKYHFYRIKMLQFLLELTPEQHRREVLSRLADPSDSQASIYSKIILVYEICGQRLCSIQHLQDQLKKSLFNGYCAEYLANTTTTAVIDTTLEVNKKRATSELLFNQALLKTVAYEQHLVLYLEYISYIHNQHLVDAALREKAAKVYYSTRILSEVPSQLKGRRLIEATILHIFERFLNSEQLRKDKGAFALLGFRIYDFLLMLDMGTVEEFINWTQSIFSHPAFLQKYKHIFLMRVIQSAELNKFRITKKGDKPRIEFISQLEQWVFEKNKNLKDWSQQRIILQKSVHFEEGLGKNLFSREFLDEFGIQCSTINQLSIRFTSLEARTTNFSSFYNSMVIDAKSTRIMYFMAVLYTCFYFKSNTASFAKNITNVLMRNIADPTIFNQFIFSFKTYFAYYLTSRSKFIGQITEEVLMELNNYMLQISSQDLTLFSGMIYALINRLKIQNTYYNYHSKTLFLFSSPSSFIVSFTNASISLYRAKLSKQPAHHDCVKTSELFNLFSAAKSIIPSKCQQVLQLLSDKNIAKIDCRYCKQAALNCRIIQRLQSLLFEYCSINRNQEQGQRKERILQQFFVESDKMEKRLATQQPTEDNLNITEMVLGFGQLLCCLGETLEQRYSGVLKYYRFCIKHKCVKFYFKSEVKNSFPIMATLTLLRGINYHDFISFLLQLASATSESRLERQYESSCVFISAVFRTITDQQLLHIFSSMKGIGKRRPQLVHVIALIENIIIISMQSFLLKQKVCAHLLKAIQRLFYLFKNYIAVNIYDCVCSHLKLACTKRRNYVYCNNKMVKLLVIEGIGIRMRQKKNLTKYAVKTILLKKIQRIPNCKIREETYSFITK